MSDLGLNAARSLLLVFCFAIHFPMIRQAAQLNTTLRSAINRHCRFFFTCLTVRSIGIAGKARSSFHNHSAVILNVTCSLHYATLTQMKLSKGMVVEQVPSALMWAGHH